MKPVKGLVVREWKPDVVYLIQFPRTHIVPSPSPFSLKLETWLRMNGLKYLNVSNEFKKASAKGQIPFVELNGRQFSDSNQIIEHLRSHFKLAMDGKLNSLERANARAYTILIEESLFRCMLYDRSQDMSWVATDRGWLQHMKGVPKLLFQKLGVKQYQSQLKKVLMAQGYGRHSQAEIEEITGKDLMALSTLLGEKSFLFGEHPTTLDATLFGHLVQLTDCPLHSKAIKPLLEKSAPNLLGFVQRVKRRYWPDWQEICDHLAMNPEDVEANKAAAATATVVVTHPPTHHHQQQQQHHQQAQKAH